MPIAYKFANLVCSTSIEPEAFGRVSIEAQSMEKPIIASNIGGSKETIINDKTGEPDKERTNRIHQQALRNGLIMITAGTFGNIIRTLMPLTIDKATLNEGIDILINALKTH